ncbi:hypothetical protein LTR28_000952, partial [Elasticomyces elasticus]
MFNRERLLLANPKALAEVLVTKSYEFIKPPQFRQGIANILGVGILLAEGDEHKTQRKNLMPAFAFRHTKDLYPVFWSKSRELTNAVSASIVNAQSNPSRETPGTEEKKHAPNVIEVSGWVSRAALDIIGVAGMGQDFHALRDPDNELNKTYRRIFSPSKSAQYLQFAGQFLPLWFVRRLPVKRNDDIKAASELIKQTCRDLIAAKKAKTARDEKGGRAEVDILSVALECGGFSDESLVNQMMTFLAAGHETTASAMSWAIYLLCQHPDVQTRLRSEVRGKLPSIRDADAPLSAADIDSCAYLQAVCNEVLRLWPPVGLTFRVAAADTSILGTFVPKDTLVVICPWAINRNTALWGADARDFNPERWLRPGQANKGGADSNYSFLTFLHGPRSCIGQAFAKA